MKIIINFSDENFIEAQNLNTKTAYKYGGADKVISYSPNDIDMEFFKKNKKILTQSRGGGYWLWKPYFIKRTLEEIDYGDYLFYCDSGACFCSNIDYLIGCLESYKQDILCFEIPLIEKQWTKRDCFILMDCDYEEYTDTNQRIATYMLIKKSKKSMNFIEDYLKYSCDEKILTDLDNTLNKENYEGFIEHRHDQSIFSLLTKKYGFEGFREPSQYGDRPWEYFKNNRFYNQKVYENSKYPRILLSYRKADIKRFKRRERIKDVLQKFRLRFI